MSIALRMPMRDLPLVAITGGETAAKCRRQCGANRSGENNATWKHFLSSELDKADDTIRKVQQIRHFKKDIQS